MFNSAGSILLLTRILSIVVGDTSLPSLCRRASANVASTVASGHDLGRGLPDVAALSGLRTVFRPITNQQGDYLTDGVLA
jgi:hypothetical protein